VLGGDQALSQQKLSNQSFDNKENNTMKKNFMWVAMSLLIILAMAASMTTIANAQLPVFGLGDVDDDGAYTQNDVTITRNHILGVTRLACLAQIRADVNASRSITTRDLIELQRAVNGITSDFTGLDNMLGDANVDNDVTQADLDAMQRHILGSAPLAPRGAMLADVSRDGAVTTRDMVIIRRCMLDTDGSYSLFN
jgi:hypothetical protein